MEIFKWAKEIEKVYEDLINEAINERNTDINELENKEKEILNQLINAKLDFVSTVLNQLHQDVDNSVEDFNIKFEEIVNQIQTSYEQNKSKLTNTILEKIGLDF